MPVQNIMGHFIYLTFGWIEKVAAMTEWNFLISFK